MSNTLLPCPFCGGKAKLEVLRHGGKQHDFAKVCCTKCNAKIVSEIDVEYSAKDKAVTDWNARCGKDTNIVTNADRIRGMSDKELATAITKNPPIPCRMCEYYNHKLGCCGAQRDFACVTAYTEALALDWLKQPAKEEHNETDRC